MMIRQRSAITVQQAPLAALQAAAPPSLLNTAESTAQFNIFQKRYAKVQRHTSVMIASSGVEKNRRLSDRIPVELFFCLDFIIFLRPKLIAFKGNCFVNTIENRSDCKINRKETCHQNKDSFERLA